MSRSNLHVAWARLFARSLASAGIDHVVVSPGSRSTPLALAFAEEAGMRLDVIVDERSAAFFALGRARLTGRPSALLCTSGTAGAHYLPAIIEASQSYVPLVVVTADRPWEAYDSAASQTVDQVKLFGDHVRHFAELGLPDPSRAGLAAVVRIASQASQRARGPVPGAVHVNARFRKPLEPVDVADGPEPWDALVRELLAAGAPCVHPPRLMYDARSVDALAAACVRGRRGLIVCGPGAPVTPGSHARDAIGDLARATGYPVLAEATSGVRFGSLGDDVAICGSFDAVLRAPSFRERHAPELILQIGAPPVSAGYASYVEAHPSAHRWSISPYGWNDPFGGADGLIAGDVADVAQALVPRLTAEPCVRDAAWRQAWLEADARATRVVARELEGAQWHEGVIARRVVESLPEGAVLIVGNSSPVRDVDTFTLPMSRSVAVLHQRGAAGIDGLVSGAAGAATASQGPVVLLLGDLALLHDLGGLAATRNVEVPLVVVVVHNDGGRIFEQLPLASRPDLSGALERLFVAPQHVDFTHAASLFGLRHARVTSDVGLRRALADALDAPGTTVVEAVVPPADGSARRRAMFRDIAAELT